MWTEPRSFARFPLWVPLPALLVRLARLREVLLLRVVVPLEDGHGFLAPRALHGDRLHRQPPTGSRSPPPPGCDGKCRGGTLAWWPSRQAMKTTAADAIRNST